MSNNNNKILYGGKSKSIVDTRGLGAFFYYSAEKFASRICQIDGDTGEEETFASVKTRTTRAAIELRKRGITQNDIILFCSKNNLNNAIPVVGALYLGAKVASTDPTLSVRDTAHAINLVRPKCIFVEEDSLGVMQESLKGTTDNPLIVVFGNSDKYATFDEFQKESPLEEDGFRPVEIADCKKETAVIFFSSGTTGMPKGICCTHYGLLHASIASIEMNSVKPVALMHFTSLYWITAAVLTIMSFAFGGYRVVSSKIEPEKLLRLIEKYKVTFIFMAPIFTYQLTNLKNAEKYDTSSLYSIWLGGTALSVEQLERTRKLLKHTHVTLAYGATEASGYIAIFDLKRDKNLYLTKGFSSGKPGLDVEIKIVDIETRKILGHSQRGEICFKSPFQMNGYYNRDSSEAYDEDNFIKTGDIGYYDEDNCIYIVDRIKEMFKYQSWHVVPAVLEGVLQEHPAVQEAVVFGLPHEIDGFHPAACVTLKAKEMTSVEELHKFVEERVAEVQKLRGGIRIVEKILKTPSGKVQRQKMKEEFLNNK